MKVLLTQRQGLKEEEIFIASHAKYAKMHGYEHIIMQDYIFPEIIKQKYKNPYKFAKPFFIYETLNKENVEDVLFIESDVCILDFNYKIQDGDYVANNCMDIDNTSSICPCIMKIKNTKENRNFYSLLIDLLKNGIPDRHPYDETLFYLGEKISGLKWVMDRNLCGYHRGINSSTNAEYSDGKMAVHMSGLSWPNRSMLIREYLKPSSDKVGVVIACKDRTENLMSVLDSWHNSPKISEIVIVDWNNNPPIKIQKEKVKIIRVDNVEGFNQGKAFNLGFNACTCDIIIKADADYKLNSDLIIPDKRLLDRFITGHFMLSIDASLNGFLMVRKSHFNIVGGYREDLEGWGHDDSDLYSRLADIGLKHEVPEMINYAVIHLPHNERAKLYSEKDIQKSRKENAYRCLFPQNCPSGLYKTKSTFENITVVDELEKKSLKPILSYDDYKDIFEPYRDSNALFFFDKRFANYGDELILMATLQLFKHYNIKVVNDVKLANVAFFTGGGNMGNLYGMVKEERRKFLTFAKQNGLKTVILPQSFNSEDETSDLADIVYVREKQSLKYCPKAILSHDLSLCLNGWIYKDAEEKQEGVFLRSDAEATKDINSDPVTFCNNVWGYLYLANIYSKIITNRLHFGVAGIILGKNVIFVNNSYGKIKAVWEHSLSNVSEFKEI